MAESAVRCCFVSSAASRMASVRAWRSRTCSSRVSACATSSAACAMTSFAGRWLALCRRTAASETSYNDASERFDAPPTRASSIASLPGCSQMVQLRGMGGPRATSGATEPGAVIAVPISIYPTLTLGVPADAVVKLPTGRPHPLGPTSGYGVEHLLDPLVVDVVCVIGIRFEARPNQDREDESIVRPVVDIYQD